MQAARLIPPREEQQLFSRAYPLTAEDEIVISGVAGRYPNSANVYEFAHNLYNKVDLVDDDEKRWKHTNAEIPKRMGKVSNLEKFDATFFGVHFKQAHTMDPQSRMLIEHAYEAVLDAGVNPKSIRGSRIGVFVGACFAESEKTWFYEKMTTGGFGITGCARSMLANRISYTLGLTGPSFLTDTACSSSMYALDCAFNAIRCGECDAALVGGSNLLLHPYTTLQFARLGVLSADGYCRPFDHEGTGYTRSEAICVLFLQKAKDAKRIYANLLYSKTNCDGYKEEGITFPSRKLQTKLLTDFYQEINIDPSTVDYVEAHCTGTLVGDPEECKALDQVFCAGRDKPLPIGSVKSNMGHSESSSGVCSITKAILAFESGKIPPNINFSKIRPGIESLEVGRLQVVTETQELSGPLISINSFGFGGGNAHAIFKAHYKDKVNNGAPSDSLPRLIVWSGRTEEAVNSVLDDIVKRPLDVEHVALIHNTQRESVSANVFKGFGIYSYEEGKNANCMSRDVQHFIGLKRPMVWVFSGMGSQWPTMGRDLLQIPIFRESIEKSYKVMATKGLNLMEILTSEDEKTFDNILNSFVGIAAIQIGIVDILKELGMEPDYIIGHSVGELGCAYADGCFTAEQMILSAYSRGMASIETKTVFGSMAAVGMGYKKLKPMTPPEIEIACHNGPDSCTISGPSENIATFVADLKSKKIFAKEVQCSNIPYHSSYIAEMGPNLLSRLSQVIPQPKKRSSKWLSSSVPKIRWDKIETQYSSAQYHTNNLLSSVLFEETSALLPNNALTIEIAPHGLLQAILKKSMANGIHVGLTQRGNKDNVHFFLNALGKIYMNGVDFPIDKIYPPVEFPVSKGTAMISPLIKWEHNEDYFVTKFENQKSNKSGERRAIINLAELDYEYIEGHVIDGRVLFPATAYLHLVWETVALMRGVGIFELGIEFEDVKILRATIMPKNTDIEFTIMVQPGGRFEIAESSAVVCNGYVNVVENSKISEIPEHEKTLTKDCPVLPTKDFYKELRLRGYHYNGSFRSVAEARSDGLKGKVKWDNNWVSFMDCLLQIFIIGQDTRNLLLPIGIKKMTINPKAHEAALSSLDPKNPVFDVQLCKLLNKLRCEGIEICGLQANPVSRRKPPSVPVLEIHKFISHMPTPILSEINVARFCVQLALENVPTHKVKSVEIDCYDDKEPLIPLFSEALGDLPLVTSESNYLTTRNIDLGSVIVEDQTLQSHSNCLFLIKSNCLSDIQFLESVTNKLGTTGFIVSRENCEFNLELMQQLPSNYQILAVIPTNNETIILMQYVKKKIETSPKIVHIPSSNEYEDYEWIETLKKAIKSGSVIAVAQNEEYSGIMGLVTCIRKEPDGNNLKCVFIDDPDAPAFDLNSSFYKFQLKLGLAMNVLKNKCWGTYRHLLLNPIYESKSRADHCYANALTKGDLSSMTWLRGPYNDVKYNEGEIVSVKYASLNFRDVMLATGKLTSEVLGSGRLDQECVLGFEYSGVSQNGKRLMGMVISGALATHIKSDDTLIWNCPDYMTLEQAATIPVVYGTVYSAFFLTIQIKRGNSILIHAGSGGVGLAAIRVAFAYGLEVFTTVSTVEKKNYLLEQFPHLKEENIGNSRDITFEEMVMRRTNGKGVNYVLNSLAGEKLEASIRCLGKGGKFLEIGKFDIANDNKIGLGTFMKEISFHAVLVDNLFRAALKEKKVLQELIENDLNAGIIKPLKTTVFAASEIENAFRYLASGKHIGKVLLKVRENENDIFTYPIRVIPRVYCNPDYSYVIPGGLGGFGLELADWLILRGCRKLVLSSSKGISKPYQAYRIKIWESYGVKVEVNTSNILTMKGCEKLLIDANKLGPVGGIFNLAVVLADNIFDNQDASKFIESMGPKAVATKYFDVISRKICPTLKYFVVFSSVSCGRGNAGQSNYGMANSVMERIVEQRHADGFPAKAIQWGAVGEVGLVADMQEDQIDMEIGGTLQQRISSCLEELDTLLYVEDAVVSSMVVAEKKIKGNAGSSIIESVMHIMNIKDIKSVSMDTTLSEMGMDSLMAVEIRQTLEREYELALSPQDLRTMTFLKLQELTLAKESSSNENIKLKFASDEIPTGIEMLLRNLGDEENSGHTLLRVPSHSNSVKHDTCVLLVPGIEGVSGNAWRNIASSITLPTYVLQLTNTMHLRNTHDITKFVFKDVHERLFDKAKEERFYLVGYSFGAFITLELAKMLEESGLKGQVVLIDGAPLFLKKLAVDQMSTSYSDEVVQVVLIAGILHTIFPEENVDMAKLLKECPTWEERVDRILELCKDQQIYSEEYLRKMTYALFYRIKMALEFDMDSINPIKSNITLVRPNEVSVVDIDEEYGLSKYTTGIVSLKFVEGNHITMLENLKLSQIINEHNPDFTSNDTFKKHMEI